MTPDEHIAALQRLVYLYRMAWLYKDKSVTVGDLRPVLDQAIRSQVEVEDEPTEEIDRGYGLGGVPMGSVR